MALEYDKLQNPFVRTYLDYVAQTESPRVMHLWCALACVSAAMGRHLYLDTGIGQMFGNMYVLLVGPPGTRKSSAIRYASTLMRESTTVRWAPDDTAGQRQGLITSMIEDETLDTEEADTAAALDAETVGNMRITVSNTDRHTMFINASEFGTFLGTGATDLIRFLGKMWDGENYRYRLRKSEDVLTDPLINMLGGTTPTEISTLLPAEAIGQGFMSRTILVYAPGKEKSVPPSQMRLAEQHAPDLQAVYSHVFYNMHGAMRVEPDASKLIDDLYAYELKVQDTRFIYYAERRQTHLMKLAMALAAARLSMMLEREDVIEAQRILSATEVQMPDALGEYGMSPIAVARQKMLEFLRHAGEPVSDRVLYVMMQRDMTLVDFRNSLSGLINADKVVALDTEKGRMYMYKDEVTKRLAGLSDEDFDALLDTDPVIGGPTIQ